MLISVLIQELLEQYHREGDFKVYDDSDCEVISVTLDEIEGDKFFVLETN